jgi:metallo-beta-lactamase family protein
MSSKNKKVRITFVGENSSSVTGSCTLIEYKDKKILLECGLFQSNNQKTDYQVNTKKFKFKPKDIDYIFVGHTHIDHIGLIPRLYKEGCHAEIICTHKTVEFMPTLLKDSAYIMERDSMILSKGKNIEIEPIYDDENVNKSMHFVRGHDFDKLYELDENISFKFIPAGHIVGSAQLVLYIKEDNGRIHKILYTSDLGNIKLNKPFVEEFEKETKSNIVIGECTYGGSDRVTSKKDREKDIEKIKSVVLDTCLDKKGRVLIPSFALDRTQFMLKILYDLFGEDENFDIPIIIDSPLACKMTDIYKYVLDGENKELIKKITSWENVKFVSDADASKLSVADETPKIIISSSGMMTAGRVIHYTKSILEDGKSTILFCGFSAENSLAYKIKNNKLKKPISIDGKKYKNKCSIVDLKSFSSHMQREDLLNYYKQINCQAIYLVHGEMNGKIEFANQLKQELSDENKSTHVCVVNKSTSILL